MSAPKQSLRVGFLLKLDPDLLARVRAKAAADGETISGLVSAAVAAHLGDAPRTAVVMHTSGTSTTVPIVRPRTPLVGPPVCVCGHAEGSHWSRGCVAACPCQRFRGRR